MSRIIAWPRGLKITARAPLTGPRAARSASSESVTGFVQTVASPFGLWRWQFTFASMHKDAARRYRGFVVAMHGGVNATIVPFRDPDGLSLSQAGVATDERAFRAGVPWSGGAMWTNGEPWGCGLPVAPLSAAAAKGASVVALQNVYWGQSLMIGDQIGFGPLYLGLHVVTEVQAPGQYRIWPPLRAALPSDRHATLDPSMAMRLESESAAPVERGSLVMSPSTMTLVEVEDPDVRLFYR